MLKEGQVRIPSGCAIAAIYAKDDHKINGSEILKSIAVMHERSNGLGGGFVGYGIYPEYAEAYAIHMFFDHQEAKIQFETLIFQKFKILKYEEIPSDANTNINDVPLIWRYFVLPLRTLNKVDEEAFVVDEMLKVNEKIEGAYCFSMGQNMGVFKGVGYPEEIGKFFKLDTYEASCWIAHGRYPTNTPGWWGGAHPFSILDVAVVHNGEISSYDMNRRMIEMQGYKCTLQTDTEVIAYMIDDLTRKKKLTLNEAAQIMTAPFWDEIDKMDPEKRAYYTYLRKNFASYLITGPFSILVGTQNGIMALNDRCKLRSMVLGENSNTVYFASEESAIRVLEVQIDKLISPKAGEAVIYHREEEFHGKSV